MMKETKMKKMRLKLWTWSLFGALLLAGCGLLSNDLFFDGVGQVSGTLLLNGLPAEGAVVFVPDAEDGVFERASTDAEGRFMVRAWAGRGRTLLALWGSSMGLARDFDLAAEGKVDLGELELETLGELRGRLLLAGGDAREGEVEVIGSALVARPDDMGRFAFQLPPGTWDLQFSAIGYESQDLNDVVLEAAQSTELDLVELLADSEHVCLGSEMRTERYSQGGGGQVDLLFIIDNSGSMVGEQVQLAESFADFVDVLADAGVDFRLGVITTGMESEGCGACTVDTPYSCVNESGESGRLQQRLGHLDSYSNDVAEFSFEEDEACRIVGPDNLDCFYGAASQAGVALVGVNGCGYERGLAAMRAALDPQGPHAEFNAGFVRPTARLAVVALSDEDDCGEVGDISENIAGAGGRLCYYAARGEGPAGTTSHPFDLDQKVYALTPVSSYADFLRDLKYSVGLVTFSAIVGVSDPDDPAATRIEYMDDADPSSDIVSVCSEVGCEGRYCNAYPGTRYIELALETGGMVDSICSGDFSQSLTRLVRTSTGYLSSLPLSREPSSADAIVVQVNGEPHNDWIYDSETRALIFDKVNQPHAYDAVTIQYVAICQ